MTATVINGRELSRAIREELSSKLAGVEEAPRMDILIVGSDPATQSFVRAKRIFAHKLGVEFVEHRFEEGVTAEELLQRIEEITPLSNGIVVQLPLPANLNQIEIVEAIPHTLDIDVLATSSGEGKFIPPVAGAIHKILEKHKVSVSGKQVVIIGKGKLVGLPTGALLQKHGARVSFLDSASNDEDFRRDLQRADIVVSGAGSPGIVQPHHVKEGVVLLDAGTSGTEGVVFGDIDMDCEGKASLLAKTPGGVGPVTVAQLFENLIKNFTTRVGHN